MKKVVITGTTKGIGKQIATLFLQKGYIVVGIDKLERSINHENYSHIICDISKDELPQINDVAILINNAGVQNEGNDIDVNLKAAINVTEKYAFNNDKISSVVFIASASARTGLEFPEYAASKGGLVAYMKNVALRLAPHATSNSISPGGVTTLLNANVLDDNYKWARIMQLTPLKKWASADEVAEWVYFVAVINKSMTGQDILIDNGEAMNGEFIW